MPKKPFDVFISKLSGSRDRRRRRGHDLLTASPNKPSRFFGLKARFVLLVLWTTVLGLALAFLIQLGALYKEYHAHFGETSVVKRLIRGELQTNDLTSTDSSLRTILKAEFDDFEDTAGRGLVVISAIIILSILSWGTLIAFNRRHVLRERKRFITFETIIASIGHDFGNPLGTIQDAIRMLSRDLPSDGRRHYYTVAHKATGSLTRLVTDILQVTQGEPLSVDLRYINIEHWFADFVALYAPKVKNKHLTFKTSIDTHPMRLNLDPDRLTQCIGNLMDNALRYTTHGEIELTLSVRSKARDSKLKALIVKVKDTGRGISHEDLHRIFLPFERAHDVESMQGMGLGLSIVNNFAKRSGGTVEVHSQLGRGSTFTFLMPVEEGPYNSVPWEEDEYAHDPFATAVAEVLVVGSDADATAAILDEAGYSVNIATDSKAAMLHMSKLSYKVVVIFIGLSDLVAGLEIASECKKLSNAPYTIAITTCADKIRADHNAVNFDEVLTHPASIDTLMRSMEMAFDQDRD